MSFIYIFSQEHFDALAQSYGIPEWHFDKRGWYLLDNTDDDAVLYDLDSGLLRVKRQIERLNRILSTFESDKEVINALR